jgi:hypothetical protein
MARSCPIMWRQSFSCMKQGNTGRLTADPGPGSSGLLLKELLTYKGTRDPWVLHRVHQNMGLPPDLCWAS